MLRAAERRELLARALATVRVPVVDAPAVDAPALSVPLRARYTAQQFLLTAEDFMPVDSESEDGEGEGGEEEEEEGGDNACEITHVVPADEAKRRRCRFVDLS